MRFGSFLCLQCLLLLPTCIFVSAQLEVIGAGFGRTGTDSLRLALNILGYQTYHMRVIVQNNRVNDFRLWTEFFKGECPISKLAAENFEKDGYTAAVDFPTAAAWKELATHYPNAKIILTERDSPEQWWESARATIIPPNIFYHLRHFLPIFRQMDVTHRHMFQRLFKLDEPRNVDITHDAEISIDGYKQNSIDARAFDPERTLVFNVRQGWEPLCAFLGKEVPKDIPFPHANSKADIQMAFVMLGAVCVVAVLLIVMAVIFIIKKISPSKKGGVASSSLKKE